MKSTVPLQDNGRVSIPASIRRELEIEQGDLVEITVRTVEGER